MVDKIESGLQTGKYTLMISMDIAGAYDNVNIEAISKGFEDKQIPYIFTKWYKFYVSHRIARAAINDNEIERSLTKGVPQGGVISSFAWNLAIDDILQQNNAGPIKTIGFADDICVLVTGIDPDTLVQLAQPVVDKITELGESKGLSFNTEKTVAVM